MRDKKGRFPLKDEEGFSITFKLPSFKVLIHWIFINFMLVLFGSLPSKI